MRIKAGVSLQGVRPEILVAALIVNEMLVDAVITSGCDGQHMVDSLHYSGYALDFRTRDLSPEHIGAIARKLRMALGAQYDVVVESDHLHVEFDAKES